MRKAIEGWTVKAASIRSAASLSWPCNTQHTVRYSKLSPARFKDFWGYIASIVGRVKISILLSRYGRIAGKLVPPWGDGLARVNDDISLLEGMRT
jgi:hypothetical protein